jgi:hypothetical protein
MLTGETPAPLLTIAIPTYERPAALLRTVSRIVPQLTAQTLLLVLDNASPTPARGVLPGPVVSDPRVTVVRHPVNVGGNANILRCLEWATTPYVWLLGDDDLPLPGAVESVLRHVQSDPGVACWRFSSDTCEYGDSVVNSATEFWARIGSLKTAMWISNMVYSRERIAGDMREAYLFLSTCAGHLVPALLALERGEGVMLARERIVDYGPTDPGEFYDRAAVFVGLCLLPHARLCWPSKQLLGRKVTEVMWSPESLALWVSQVSGRHWSPAEKRYRYRFLRHATYSSFAGPWVGARAAVCQHCLWLFALAAKADALLTGGRFLVRRGISAPEDSERT